jgi:hypothetical protein
LRDAGRLLRGRAQPQCACALKAAVALVQRERQLANAVSDASRGAWLWRPPHAPGPGRCREQCPAQ